MQSHDWKEKKLGQNQKLLRISYSEKVTKNSSKRESCSPGLGWGYSVVLRDTPGQQGLDSKNFLKGGVICWSSQGEAALPPYWKEHWPGMQAHFPRDSRDKGSRSKNCKTVPWAALRDWPWATESYIPQTLVIPSKPLCSCCLLPLYTLSLCTCNRPSRRDP